MGTDRGHRMGYFRVRREPTRPLHLSLGLPLVVTCDRASPTAARQPESSVNLAPFVVHISRTRARPNAIRTTYSSRLTRTVKHCSVGCVRLARQQGLMAARRIVLEVDLDKAPWSVSHLRLRLTAATAIPSRRALYPLQTHRSLFSTTSLHQCRHAATH